MRALLVLLVSLSPALAFAGGWTQPEGNAYAKLWYRGLFGSNAFGADGETFELPDSFTDQAVNLYAEVGLHDHLTLVVHSNPFGMASIGDGSTTYVGRTAVGLRGGLAMGKTRLAIEGQYAFAPDIGEEAIASGVADTGEAFTYIPAVKTQSISGELQIGHPLSFGWLVAHAGWRGFTRSSIDPVITGFAQLGWNINQSWVLDAHVNLNEPLGDVEVTNVAGVGQTAYLGVGFGLSWWFSEAFALNTGFEGVAYARSNAATPTLTLGVEYRGQLWNK
jgi:hypothetical protein